MERGIEKRWIGSRMDAINFQVRRGGCGVFAFELLLHLTVNSSLVDTHCYWRGLIPNLHIRTTLAGISKLGSILFQSWQPIDTLSAAASEHPQALSSHPIHPQSFLCNYSSHGYKIQARAQRLHVRFTMETQGTNARDRIREIAVMIDPPTSRLAHVHRNAPC